MLNLDNLDLPFASDVCYCTVCNEYFSSETSYSKHRPGKVFPITCLTVAEMEAKGMARNKYGRWVTRAWEDAAQTHMELTS